MASRLGNKPILIGILMAAVFIAVDMMAPVYVAYETIVLVSSVCLFLVCLATMDALKDGLICGLTTLVAYNAGEFARYSINDEIAVGLALLPNSLLLTSTYIIAGILGGYLGARLGSTNSHAPSKRLRRRERR